MIRIYKYQVFFRLIFRFCILIFDLNFCRFSPDLARNIRNFRRLMSPACLSFSIYLLSPTLSSSFRICRLSSYLCVFIYSVLSILAICSLPLHCFFYFQKSYAVFVDQAFSLLEQKLFVYCASAILVGIRENNNNITLQCSSRTNCFS